MTVDNKTSGQLEKFGYSQDLNRVLSLSSLIYYGLAYLVPLTIFTTYGLVSNMTHGMLSLAYLVATVAMAFTAFSYNHMVKAFPIAGSAYSYAHRSISPYVGFMSGWVILLDYMLLPMINYLVAALFIVEALPGLPNWAWILIFIVLVTVVNYFGIQVTSWANSLLIWVQVVFVLALMFFIIKWISAGGGAGTFFDWSAFFNSTEFNKPDMGWKVIFGGASILALSFLGFDAVSTVSEEAHNPEVNVGRAIIITCIGAGLFFIVITYFTQLAWPTGWNEFKSVDTGAYELISKVAGSFMGYFFTAAYVLGCMASAIASQSSASRILFGMGRDGILPKKFFAYLHPKYKTPTRNIFLIAVISLAALVLSLSTAASLINFGALIGFVMVNISVISHYFIRNKQRGGRNLIRYLLLPAAGALICLVIWFNLDIKSKELGLTWTVVGLIYLAITTKFFKKLPPEMDFNS
ncbi:APC family permease [Desulfotruncus alcoholivorax]|uniref:APC family permease n=1 Tax=Desulfotruncus alcoholivorax TaxID=265477 RepID=UPI00041414AA|nr:APC family permease [Desulfotruncus alcoholivorax]